MRGMLMFGKDVRTKQIVKTKEGSKVKNLRRVERIIRLIGYLQQERTYSEIKEYMGISYKSATRYIVTLAQLGFEVQRIHNKRHTFKILNTAEVFKISGTESR